jgi:RNA-binding protein PNO1
LKEKWPDLVRIIVEESGLQVRYSVAKKRVDMRGDDAQTLAAARDFVHAFLLGFEFDDALSLLRMSDSVFVDSFDVNDVKLSLAGDNLSRAVGRICGKEGRAKFTIENATRTRIVVAEKRIHIMGSYRNIAKARAAVCDLILGSPINKVYARLS